MSEFRILVLDAVASTNEEVKRALEEGEPEGLAVRARRQTGGYGRQGRAWASPEGGLYLSLLLRPRVEPEGLSTLSLVVGLAVRRAVAALLPAEEAALVRLKWPNDVVVCVGAPLSSAEGALRASFRKLCGISLERHAGGVCVGIGVNVLPPDDARAFAGDAKNEPAYLSRMGFDGDAGELAAAVLRSFSPLYGSWQERGFAPFVGEYAACDALAGHVVRMVDRSGKPLACGTAAGVDEAGRLLLEGDGGSLRAVSSGEAHLA